MPNSDIGGQEENSQQLTGEPDKQNVHAANWAAVDWHRVEARVFHTQREIFEAIKQGNHERAYRLQQGLTGSFHAKLLAVRHATEDSRGKDTPGTDGQASLSDKQKWILTTSISIHTKPRPIRRASVPKPGKKERRPLGIPAIRDRAVQHLIKLALEPAVEALLAPEQFGFRPGRNCWDAASHLRFRLRKPAFVLDADIRAFFDRLSHDAIIRALPCPRTLRKAVRRLLKCGILDGVEIIEPESGTPQGGPLSPLLANLALAKLPAAIREQFPTGGKVNGEPIGTTPYIAIYADDLVVVHQKAEVLQEAQRFLDKWLAPWGLELHPEKTKIRHTANVTDGIRGVDFLSLNFRHHLIGKHQGGGKKNSERKTRKPRGPKWFLWTGPSKAALKRVYADCAAIIAASSRSRKRRGEILDKARKGQATPENVMVIRLNAKLRGWCGFHRAFFAKEAFSEFDHKVFHKLFRRIRRNHPGRKVGWIIREYYGNANPWRFRVTRPNNGQPLFLVQAASIPIQRHFPVIAAKSWFDGDWSYWGRRAGHYPMLTPKAARMLKVQHGKCPVCKTAFATKDQVKLGTISSEGTRRCREVLVHRHCADALTSVLTDSPFVSRSADRSPVLGNGHAGFEVPSGSRELLGTTATMEHATVLLLENFSDGAAPAVGKGNSSGATIRP